MKKRSGHDFSPISIHRDRQHLNSEHESILSKSIRLTHVESSSDLGQFYKEHFEQYALTDNENNYLFVVKRLQYPTRLNNGLRVFVPEIVQFYQGEPKIMIYTQRDKYIRFIKQKEKMTLQEVRKHLNDKRTKYRQQADHYLETNFAQFKPKADAEDAAKKKNDVTAQNAQMQQQGDIKDQERDSREAVLCRFDIQIDTETRQLYCQVMNEKEFLNLMMKRKVRLPLTAVECLLPPARAALQRKLRIWAWRHTLM